MFVLPVLPTRQPFLPSGLGEFQSLFDLKITLDAIALRLPQNLLPLGNSLAVRLATKLLRITGGERSKEFLEMATPKVGIAAFACLAGNNLIAIKQAFEDLAVGFNGAQLGPVR